MIELNVFNAPLKNISLVEAGAGTGKTYNITSLYLRAIVENKLLPAQILVLTYTDAATAELKSRIRNRLREAILFIKTNNNTQDAFLIELKKRVNTNGLAHLEQALKLFDKASIFTIHGFCKNILSEFHHYFNVNANFEIQKDEKKLLQTLIDRFWRDFVKEYSRDTSKRNILKEIHSNSLNPDELFKILEGVLKNPEAKFLPEKNAISAFFVLSDELEKKFKAVKNEFTPAKEDLHTLITNDGLSGTYYKNKEKLYSEFEDWIGSNDTLAHGFDRIHLFGANKIESSVKKAFELESLPLNLLMDEYLDLREEFKLVVPAFIHLVIEKVFEKYDVQKNENNVLSFNDLLSRTKKGLESKHSEVIIQKLRDRFPLALVDEFQDTDPIQYSIFNKIYTQNTEDAALFMIGDPKQAIYGFRGANLPTYLKAKEDALEDQRYMLLNNFRSNDGLINAVTAVFTHKNNSFKTEGLQFNAAKPPELRQKDAKLLLNNKGEKSKELKFLEVFPSREKKEAESEAVIESCIIQIKKLLSNQFTLSHIEIKSGDIAILVSTHRQGAAFQHALRKNGLKSVIKSIQSVYKSEEANEFQLILKAFRNLGNESNLRAALSTEIVGFKVSDVADILENEQKWSSLFSTCSELNSIWTHKGIRAFFSDFDKEFGIEEHLASFDDGERRLTNYNHLIDLLSKEEKEGKSSPNLLLQHLNNRRVSEENPNEDELIRLESDDELIQIVTMHSSKGLQFPIVFAPFLHDEITKPKKSLNPIKFNIDKELFLDLFPKSETKYFGKLSKDLAHEELVAEKIRLAYVCLTRAEVACYVAFFQRKKSMQSALDHLLLKDDENPIFKDQIAKLSHYGESIELISSDLKADEWTPSTVSDSIKLSVLKFDRKESLKNKVISSFSSLLAHSKSSTLDYVRDIDSYDELKVETVAGSGAHTIFSFEKGARAGSFMHQVFEDVIFLESTNSDQIIEELLKVYGFELTWKDVIQKMLNDSLNHVLKDDIQLKNIPESELIKEMEFFFPLNHLKSNRLFGLINNSDSDNTSSISGFMKGFIDLIFQYNGKYYILDYKSNHLGSSTLDYNAEALENEIISASYNIQYHIYTLALHRFLKLRIKDYEYEKDFGGVFYLFVRGLDPRKAESGVYFDKPSNNIINQMDDLFKEGEMS